VTAGATLPPSGLPGLEADRSRLVTAPDEEGIERTWHVLDSHPPAAARPADAGTILCVHGNPTWSYAFRDVLADPPDGWRVVAPDHLDMGYSERTDTTRPLAVRIADLARLTDALELTHPVVVLAHDWGGPIALGWGLEHPDLLAGIVLTNTAVHHPSGAPAPTLIRGARLPGVLENVTVRTPTFVRAATSLSRPAIPAAVRAAYAAPYRTAARRRAVGGFVRDIPLDPEHPSAVTLDRIATSLGVLDDLPALLLWGPADPVFSERYLHDLEGRLPQADVQRVEGAGHLTPEDADLAGALRTWIPARLGGHPRRPRPSVPAGAATPEQDGRRPLWSALAAPERAGQDAIVEPPDLRVGRTAPRRRSFADLAEDVAALAVGLHHHGVRPGDRLASLVPPGQDLATLVYACWRLGAVIVLADPGLGPRGLTRALRSADPGHLVAIPRALAAATALRWPGRRIVVGDAAPSLRRGGHIEASLAELLARGHAAIAMAGGDAERLLPPPPGADVDAAIAFTSGSTGPAKGVVYRHRQLEAQRDALRATYRITDADRLVAAFAPFALYGPALGITSMVPDMDVTAPASLTAGALAEAIAAIDATLVFASPAALANVAATADTLERRRRGRLGGVRLLLSAGAPVSAGLLRRFRTILPDASAHTPYGMTEVLPVADIDLDTLEAVGAGNGVCVGAPTTGVEVRIDPLTADATPSGTPTRDAGVTGEIQIRAAHGKDRYDRLAVTEVRSATADGWHRSGDVGHLDDDGRLWIEGRLAHVITTPDGPVTPVGIEQRCEAIAHVTMAAAVGIGPPGTQVVAVVVVTDPPPGRLQLAPLSLTDRVREAAGVDVAAVLAAPRLPVDIRHESKIDRAEVARDAAAMLAGRGVARGET